MPADPAAPEATPSQAPNAGRLTFEFSTGLVTVHALVPGGWTPALITAADAVARTLGYAEVQAQGNARLYRLRGPNWKSL